MIFSKKEIQTYKNKALLSFMVACLFGCGGGGGGSSESPAAAPTDTTTVPVVIAVVDYTPDTEKLLNTAEGSADLYVEPMFSFDSFKSVRFDINAMNDLNQPLSDVMLTISVIDDEITKYDDPLLQNKSLLTHVFTDANGQIDVTLEVSQSVSKLLLELNTLGVENDVIFTLDDTGIILYSFQKNQ